MIYRAVSSSPRPPPPPPPPLRPRCQPPPPPPPPVTNRPTLVRKLGKGPRVLRHRSGGPQWRAESSGKHLGLNTDHYVHCRTDP
eukprot:1099070-Prorocentrum_minimum.AAC.1